MAQQASPSSVGKLAAAQLRLAWDKFGQRITFAKLARRFHPRYRSLGGYSAGPLTTAYWEEQNRTFERLLLPHPPFSFLRLPAIIGHMVVTSGGAYLEEELAYLQQQFSGAELAAWLAEDYAGNPKLMEATYRTSHNSVHHLYHLARFSQATSGDISRLNTVVEWGGGYGNFAKMLRRIQLHPQTYVIIDTPLFSCLQWLYLSTIFGEHSIHLLQHAADTVHEHKVNLLPVAWVKDIEIPAADFFVSTWGLSESSTEAQAYVQARDWFGAKHLLLAYQENSGDFPTAQHVGDAARRRGARIEPITFLPRNFYAFR